MQPAAAIDPAAPASPGHGRMDRLLSWLAANLAAERERWALWIPVLVGVGIGIYFWLPFEPPTALGPVALGVAAVALAVSLLVRRRVVPMVAASAVALGFAAAVLQAWWVAAPILQHEIGPVEVVAQLVAVDPLPEGTRLILEPKKIQGFERAQLPARMSAKIRHDVENLIPGTWLRFVVMLRPPPMPVMPGAYDFQRRYYFDRLGAVGGFTMGDPLPMAAPADAGPGVWRTAVEAVRAAVGARIRAALPGPSGAIAAALVTGEKHAIPPADAGAFRDAGLAHILVIAGLHMGMVAAAAFFGLRAAFALVPAIALRYPTKKWAAALALLVTFLYLLLSGATVPSRRAFVMIGLVLLAVIVDRLSLSARAIALAALVVMLLGPESATGPSFQMSFAAVAGLIAFYEALRGRLAAWHAHAGLLRRVGLYLLGIAFTTVVTTVATMPFTIYHFNRFPLYSVTANVLAVPITGFWIMPWALIACLLMPLHAEALALTPMGWGIDAVAAIAHRVTAWPGAVLAVPSMPSSGLILLSLGGLWLCIWRRRWRWLGLAPIAAGAMTLLFVRPPDIIVAGDSRLVAVRATDGSYLFSKARADKFVEETWTRRAAADTGEVWPVNGVSADGRLSCGILACRYQAAGRIVALIRKREAFASVCAAADLVVSPVPAHPACSAPLIIDRTDTAAKGGYAVWLGRDGIRIETVSDWRGSRAWTPVLSEPIVNKIGASAPKGGR